LDSFGDSGLPSEQLEQQRLVKSQDRFQKETRFRCVSFVRRAITAGENGHKSFFGSHPLSFGQLPH
jgi:hypothetical protein